MIKYRKLHKIQKNYRATKLCCSTFKRIPERVRAIITDQGTNFTSSLLKQVYSMLGIQRVKTSPYHPETDGLVERFNKTLKSMLRKFMNDSGSDWDQWLPFLLFAYREVPWTFSEGSNGCLEGSLGGTYATTTVQLSYALK